MITRWHFACKGTLKTDVVWLTSAIQSTAWHTRASSIITLPSDLQLVSNDRMLATSTP